MQVKEEWKGMQYTDLTRKELQREYSRLTRKYTDFIRQPVELDLTCLLYTSDAADEL